MPHIEATAVGLDPQAPSPVGHESPHHDTGKFFNAALVVGALGVVFGDIGTSPIYTLRTCLSEEIGMGVSDESVRGILSLIFWSLTLVVSVKYALFLMRADNRGEGGILALMVLALKNAKLGGGKLRPFLITAAVLGTALFFGDGLLTPAISVLSAVEGLKVLVPGSEGQASPIAGLVVPIALTILTVLFLVQRHGTRLVGLVAGPIMIVWFLVLAAMGVYHILHHPEILTSIDPNYAVWMFRHHSGLGLAVFGAVVLSVTGAEALYADMGHFGRRAIRQAWYFIAFPALLLNYFGQGALILADPEMAKNPFYLMVPHDALLAPLIILTTLATIIASQAVISGAFSIYRQGIQLGFLPRARIIHTSASEIGQVYVPVLNGFLMIGVILLVVSFGTSDNLAHAYGLAVTGTMLIDTVLAWFVFRHYWKWPTWVALPLVLVFGAIDVTFVSANLLKLADGGWFPALLGIIVSFIILTWIAGRNALVHRRRDGALTVDDFLLGIRGDRPRVPGTAVYLTVDSGMIPPALLHNLKHNHVLHERVILLTVRTLDVPRVRVAERLQIQAHEKNFWTVVVQYGYMEKQDLPKALAYATAFGLDFEPMTTSFFISREHLIPAAKPALRPLRMRLFIWLSENAQSAADFFRIPPNRCVELGGQIEL